MRHVVRNEASWTKATQRTRAEAKALIEAVTARASAEKFEALVDEISEHRDAARGGDIGTWSSWEATIFPRQLDAILRTQVGEVSEPVDSELGYQLFYRVTPTQRERFAMRAARFAFDPTAESTNASKAGACAQADSALREWDAALKSGTSVEALPGIEETESWDHGRGPDGIDAVIDTVPLGALHASPVVSDYTCAIFVRMPPFAKGREPGLRRPGFAWCRDRHLRASQRGTLPSGAVSGHSQL